MRNALAPASFASAFLCCGCSFFDLFDGYADGRTPEEASFQARCEAAQVIRCYGFDVPEELDRYYTPTESGGSAVIDPDVRLTGAGSLHFRVAQDATSSDLAGVFGIPFDDDDESVVVGAGQIVFVQWRQRFGPTLLDGSIAGGWRHAAITRGDAGSSSKASPLTEPALLLGNFSDNGLPTFAVSGGEQLSAPVPDSPTCASYQNATDCSSCDPEPAEPPCVLYGPDEWLTIQVGIGLASADGPDHIEAWIAHQGAAPTKVVDIEWPLGGQDDRTMAKVWFELYDGFATGTNAPGDSYIDELIIARSRIADP